jgi:hypothetical protein
MLPAIDLDNGARAVTEEIRHERPDRHLSPELRAVQLP